MDELLLPVPLTQPLPARCAGKGRVCRAGATGGVVVNSRPLAVTLPRCAADGAAAVGECVALCMFAVVVVVDVISLCCAYKRWLYFVAVFALNCQLLLYLMLH